MTSTWPETRLIDPADAVRIRPARMDHQLRTSSLMADPRSDGRLVDPRLAQIVDDAAAEAATTGHEKGFAAGYQDGLAQGRAEVAARAAAERAADEVALADALERLSSLGSALEAAATSLESRTVPTYAEVAPDLGLLVCDLVESLLGRELRTDPAPVLDAIRRAAGEAPRNSPLVVRISPEDHATVTALHVDLAAIAARPIELVVDPTVEAGGAVADSGARRIDARLSTALARLRAELAS